MILPYDANLRRMEFSETTDVELMTEKQILSFKPAPRLEQVGDEHSERVQDRKHRPE